jgi:photosynthetic reaction center H subunit
MHIGSFGGNFDVAEVVLATFVLFFLGLVVYLQRESNREGFPLVDTEGRQMASTGLSGIPAPKTFILPHGGTVSAPRSEPRETVSAPAIANFPGAPLEPAGHKLLSGLGPASFANRADVPDLEYFGGTPRIVPMRTDAAYGVDAEGHDPRGYAVAGADRVVAGTIADIWFDRSESVVRYYEIALSPAFSGRHVLVPSTMVDIQDGLVAVESVVSAQFADVPGTKAMNSITLREEDMICAYYAAGTLYATPARSEPLI